MGKAWIGSRRMRALLALLPFFLFFCPHFVSPAAGAVSPVLWPQDSSDLSSDSSVIYGALSNGFRYVLMENHEPKHRVSMHLDVQVGSLNESDAEQGIAHFMEHMQFNGSVHFKPDELVKYFQKIGMQFGPDANAHTGFDETVYDVLLPLGDAQHLADGMLVMRDYADGALLLQKQIDLERGVILSEKRSRDSADYRTFESSFKFEFPQSLVSKRLPIGKESVIKTVDSPAMMSFYKRWYRPEKMILVMVGDFDPQEAKTMIGRYFSGLKDREPAPVEPRLGPIRHRGDEAFYHHEPDAGSTSVSIEVVRKVPRTPDSAAYEKETLLRDMADRILQHRLGELARKPGSPFTSARVRSGRFLKEIEFAEISANCLPGNWQACLSSLERSLRSALAYGFTPSELERVRKENIAQLDNAVKQAPTRQSGRLARKIIACLNSDQVFLSPLQEKDLLAPFIESLTPVAVNGALQRIWGAKHRLFLVTGNATVAGGEAMAEKKILSVVTESRKTPAAKPGGFRKVHFPYLPKPIGPGRIVHREDLTDVGVVQIDFENGVRLNLKKTDFESGKIHAVLSFGDGRACEPADKPGLSVLTEGVMHESALGGLTRDELGRALAGKETQLDFNVAEDHFAFEGQGPSKELPLMFQLLYAHLTDPGFRADAFSLVMRRFEQMYQRLEHDSDGAMRLSGQRFLAGGDTRFGLPPWKAFKTLSLADVQSWISPLLAHCRFEVSLVGDFSVKEAIDLASTYFGALQKQPAPGELGRTNRLKFPEGGSLTIPVDTRIPKGLVVVAYPTTDFWDIHRTRRLAVLGDIFSDRLRETVREKLGVSYSPFAYNRPSRAYKGYGLLQAFVYIDPKLADSVAADLLQIGDSLAKGGITQDELTRSVEPIVTSIKDMRRTNAYWMNSVLVGSRRHPQQIQWSRTILSDYRSITVQEVAALAKTYLVSAKAARIEVKPEGR
jgi:zinc protease